MTGSNLVMMSTVQGYWNSTQDHSWDNECREKTHYDHYNDYRYQYDTTTTTTETPKSKPERHLIIRLKMISPSFPSPNFY